ncbi:hypothetical protein ACKXF4_02130 [Faecalibacterium prausnitzii]|uniref:hypothetical protein n=1 Tax=Faecalibacterium prausnitzii TaxID=853 RepID=UPI003AAA271A
MQFATKFLWKREPSLCDYQEQPLRTEVLSREEAIHRIRLTPLIQAATRLHRRDVLKESFSVGKNYEDAFTTPEIIEHATAVACIKEKKLYHYRLHPAGISARKGYLEGIWMRSMQTTALLCLCTQVWKKDTAFLQYAADETHAPKHKKKSAAQTEKQ